MNLTSTFQRCSKVVIRIFIVHSEFHLLFTVEKTLEQRCSSVNVVSILLQRCILVVRRCNLTERLSQCCMFAELVKMQNKSEIRKESLIFTYMKRVAEAQGTIFWSTILTWKILQNSTYSMQALQTTQNKDWKYNSHERSR